MGTEISSLWSQIPTTRSYHEPHETSSLPILCPEQLIIFAHIGDVFTFLVWGLRDSEFSMAGYWQPLPWRRKLKRVGKVK